MTSNRRYEAALLTSERSQAELHVANPDSRVFYAAERTLLAWLRTGLTIMAIGFVVERFGLFTELMALQSDAPATRSVASAILGVGFVLVGALSIAVATLQHRRFIATLQPADLPNGYSRSVAVILSASVAGLGLALAAYLVLAP